MGTNVSQVADVDTERSVTAPFTGTSQTVGSALTHNPTIMIFDNQSTVSVACYKDNKLWKTFSAGQALVLDMRANDGIAANNTFPLGTQFYIVGTAGTGSFRISLIYQR